MPSPVRVRVLNVGQGDAIVGILPEGNRAFVVDVYDADRVLDFLEHEGVSEVVLFLSHSDRDHTAGASEFLAEYPEYPRNGRIVGLFYNHDRLNAKMDSEYVRLTQLIGKFSREETPRSHGYLYADFNTNLNRIPDFVNLFPPGSPVRVVHPEQADQSSLIGQDTNETAGVLMVECAVREGRPRRMLLAADVQLTGISLILSRGSVGQLQADVLKFPHHGAWPENWPGITLVNVRKSTLEDFLRAVGPSVVILSTGFDNPHGHVRQEVFGILGKHSAEVGRMRSLKCTQFTPTCLTRSSLPESGPFCDPYCAGDVEVVLGSDVGQDGVEVKTVPDNHLDRVANLNRVGCAHCRFLPALQAIVHDSGAGR